MGDIVKAECSNCKSVWELMLGAGLSHGRKENVINEFPSDEASNLRELLDSNEDWMFSFKEAVCKTCHNCIALPVIQGEISKEILAYGICPVCCSKDVEPVLTEDMGCPQCGSGRIDLCETGHWD